MNKDIIFLFLYHKNDDITNINIKKLYEIESNQTIRPVSRNLNTIKDTFVCNNHLWLFEHFDDYWMCDGMIYHYALHNKEELLSHKYVIILEYDTWWDYDSRKWFKETIQDADILCAGIETTDTWDWIRNNRNNKNEQIRSNLYGVVPFSVVCCKTDLLLNMAERVKDSRDWQKLRNNELRFGTLAKSFGANIKTLPQNMSKDIKWYCHNHKCNKSNIIVHPVKSLEQMNIDSKKQKLSLISCAYYDIDKSRKQNIYNRMRSSINRFGKEIKIFEGPAVSSLQEAKIIRLKENIEETVDTEYVLWVDASDVICLQDPELSISLLKEYNVDVLLSAESVCWPEEHYAHLFNSDNSNALSYYKYLNSGVYIAKTEKLLRCLDLMSSIMHEQPKFKEGWRTDQNLWYELYVNRIKYGCSIGLDTKVKLSLSTINISDSLIVSKNKKLFFTPTQTSPIFMHFNGINKSDSQRINQYVKEYCQ